MMTGDENKGSASATEDTWTVYGKTLSSRFFIGTALYPSPEVMQQSIKASAADVVTVSLRRQSPSQQGGN